MNLQCSQILQVLQVCLAIDEGHVNAIQDAICQAPARRKLLGGQLVQSLATGVDFFAHQSSPSGEQTQLQAVVAAPACAQGSDTCKQTDDGKDGG
ncbi:MAG: hypothetical protein O2782_12480 [bacterium]|nr:hypothetical protein [bacterium]